MYVDTHLISPKKFHFRISLSVKLLNATDSYSNFGTLSQIHKIITVRSELWRKAVLPPCSKEQVAHDYIQSDFEHLQGWRLPGLSKQPVPVFEQPNDKKKKKLFFLCLSAISCISVCGHCFLSWH